MNEIVTVRDIEIVTAEIKTIEKQVAKIAIHGCIEIGRRLTEAKQIVGHGGWGKYLETHVNYSQQWATDLMNLYKEYGDRQESLFESFANSQTFGNLDVTKHILLLAVPAEERAQFAAENDVENKSVRELKAAIRERDEANAARDEAEDRVREMEERLEEAQHRASSLDKVVETKMDEADRQRARADRAERTAAAANDQVEKLKKQLEKAKAGEKAAKDALNKAKENPEIPEEVMERLRKETDAAAAEQATAEIRKQLEAAEKVAEDAKAAQTKAEQAAKEAEQKAEAAQKQIRLANPNMVLLNELLARVQKEVESMADVLRKISAEDADTGKRITENIKTKLLPNMIQSLGE